ncbi:MAG: hypothetical protein H5T86_05295 [Armatimonadetes bacterium]|nr:hypothetical protein [Armatimonadota bacterium]
MPAGRLFIVAVEQKHAWSERDEDPRAQRDISHQPPGAINRWEDAK